MAVEGLEALDDACHIVGAVGVVYLINIRGIDGVEFQDIVVHTHQGVVHRLAVDHGRVAEYRHLGLRTILVAQADDVVDDLCEMRMTGGLAITGKGEHIGQLSISRHLLELGLELGGHLLSGGHGEGGAMVFVETTLAVDTVETAYLAVSRQQVDAKRDAQAAAVNGTENGRWIDNCTHNGCKGTFFMR